MQRQTLLTSFTTWKQHHRSNSSDELLGRIEKTTRRPLHFLRQIPVDFQLAPKQVIAKFDEIKPEILICCGMAEDRHRLSLESTAVFEDDRIKTDVDLGELTEGLPGTEISHDAGRFVCNRLYFEALRHLRAQESEHRCLFVHVPVLTPQNAAGIEEDFLTIVERLTAP